MPRPRIIRKEGAVLAARSLQPGKPHPAERRGLATRNKKTRSVPGIGLWCIKQRSHFSNPFNRTEVFQDRKFDIMQARHTKTGWQGKPPPAKEVKVIRERWMSLEILEDLVEFLLIPYEITER
jgi:hypothetical protein